MAYVFTRRPVAGADENTWAPLEQKQNVSGLSIYTAYLFNDSGTLKITAGNIGINDGTNFGVASSALEQTISLAAVTSGNWAYILMSVSGASVTFSAVDIAGETDPASFPTTTVDALWSGSRGGFYSSANRILGCIFKNSAGTLALLYNSHKEFPDNSYIKVPKNASFNSLTADTGYSAGWNTATLNAQILNEITGMSIASNQITCPPGRYKISGYCSIYGAGAVSSVRSCRVYDATNAATLILATSIYMGATEVLSVPSLFEGIFTIDETILIEIQVNAVAGDGSGNINVTNGDWRKINFEKIG